MPAEIIGLRAVFSILANFQDWDWKTKIEIELEIDKVLENKFEIEIDNTL